MLNIFCVTLIIGFWLQVMLILPHVFDRKARERARSAVWYCSIRGLRMKLQSRCTVNVTLLCAVGFLVNLLEREVFTRKFKLMKFA